VSSAIDTLVDAGGLKLDASKQDKAMAASTTVTDWVSAVCPKSSLHPRRGHPSGEAADCWLG
jgi:hypothetical protein